MTNKLLDKPLIDRLREADIVCKKCGMEYGKYSVGCSSVWLGTCQVCGESGPVTESRDYGYLSKGIAELEAEPASYEVGEITLKLTEDEDRKSTRLNSSHVSESRMPSSA